MTGQAKNTAKKRAVKANTNRANEWDIAAQSANLRQASARGKAAMRGSFWLARATGLLVHWSTMPPAKTRLLRAVFIFLCTFGASLHAQVTESPYTVAPGR